MIQDLGEISSRLVDHIEVSSLDIFLNGTRIVSLMIQLLLPHICNLLRDNLFLILRALVWRAVANNADL